MREQAECYMTLLIRVDAQTLQRGMRTSPGRRDAGQAKAVLAVACS